jgi:hypothetical protein
MKIKIEYKKMKEIFIVKLDNKLFLNYYLKEKRNQNYSKKNYNYNILLKILRIFGLIKPIYNKKDYILNK